MTLEPPASKLETIGLEIAEYPADRDAAVLVLDGASVDVLAKEDLDGTCCKELDAGGVALELEGTSVRVLATEDSKEGPSRVLKDAGGAALESEVVSEGGCDVIGAADDSGGAELVLSDCKLDLKDDALTLPGGGGTTVEDNGQYVV